MGSVEYYKPEVTLQAQALGEIGSLIPRNLTLEQYMVILEYSKVLSDIVFPHAADIRNQNVNSVLEENLARLNEARDKIGADNNISGLVPVIGDVVMRRAQKVFEKQKSY